MIPRLLTLSAAALASLAAYGAAAAAGPWPVGVAGLALALLTSVRPEAGVLLVAAFAPLGGALAALFGLRTSATEPLVLAVVAGWLLRRWARPERWDPTTVQLSGVFALLVLTSLLAQWCVAQWVMNPGGESFPGAMYRAITAGRAIEGPFRPEVTRAVRWLAGVGLFVMAVEVGRRSREAASGSLRLLMLGAAGVASLNISRFVEIVLRHGGDPLAAATEFHRFIRVSSTIADVNAAGALLALVLPAAAAPLVIPRQRWLGVAAVLAVGTGLWLTGSRAAMVGGIVGLSGYLAVLTWRRWTRVQVAVAGGVLCVTLAGLVLWYPRGAAHTAATDAWLVRKYLAIASLEMARQSPVFGVGVGRFRAESARYAPQELQRYYRAENAHNQVLQVLGELGVVGAAVFLALVGYSLVPGARRLSHPSSESLLAPAICGIVGWLLASLLMHPLLVPEASAAFWLVLGLARSVAAPPPPERPTRRWEAIGCAALAIGLLAAVPTRAVTLRNGLNLDGVGVGLSAWRRDGDVRYRTAGTSTAIYVDGRPGRLRVPLRIVGTVTPVTEVHVLLDGRPAGRLPLASDQWVDFSTLLPQPDSRSPRFRRLDFLWSPTEGARLDVGRETYTYAAQRSPM